MPKVLQTFQKCGCIRCEVSSAKGFHIHCLIVAHFEDICCIQSH